MHTVSALALGVVSWLSLCAPVAPQSFPTGKLWIVSTSGCPNVNFTTISAAIAAASDGDVILVRPGNYAGFTVDGKSLAIVGDGRGPATITSTATVQNIPSAKRVLLQGLVFAFNTADLTIANNQGPILVEDCNGIFRCQVQDTASAVLTRSGITSLSVWASQLTLYEANVSGGLIVNSGRVLLVGSVVSGSAGAPGVVIPPSFCTNGGAGGPGIQFGSASAQVFLLSTGVSGGAGGPGATPPFGFPCSAGAPGPAFSGGTPTILSSVAPWRTYISLSPVLERQSVPVTFGGEEGDTAVLAFSFQQQQLMFTQFGGTLVPQLPCPSLVAGVLTAIGPLSGNIFMPPGLVAPGEATVLFGQGLFVDAPPLVTPQPIFLGSTKAWVIFDETHDPRDGCP
jgi:hypothetical protein